MVRPGWVPRDTGAIDVTCPSLPREIDACLTRRQVNEFSRRRLKLDHGALAVAVA